MPNFDAYKKSQEIEHFIPNCVSVPSRPSKLRLESVVRDWKSKITRVWEKMKVNFSHVKFWVKVQGWHDCSQYQEILCFFSTLFSILMFTSLSTMAAPVQAISPHSSQQKGVIGEVLFKETSGSLHTPFSSTFLCSEHNNLTTPINKGK